MKPSTWLKLFLATSLVLGTAACGQPSVVKRGASTPPPSDAPLSPQDAQTQWGYRDRNNGSY